MAPSSNPNVGSERNPEAMTELGKRKFPSEGAETMTVELSMSSLNTIAHKLREVAWHANEQRLSFSTIKNPSAEVVHALGSFQYIESVLNDVSMQLPAAVGPGGGQGRGISKPPVVETHLVQKRPKTSAVVLKENSNQQNQQSDINPEGKEDPQSNGAPGHAIDFLASVALSRREDEDVPITNNESIPELANCPPPENGMEYTKVEAVKHLSEAIDRLSRAKAKVLARTSREESASLALVNERRFQRWTEEEDNILREAMKTEGEPPHQWNRIAQKHFRNQRNGLQCKSRWNKIQPGIIKGSWQPHEDSLILRLRASGLKWKAIADRLPGRVGEQIHDRYANVLDPNLKTTPWTAEEDTILMEQQRVLGNKWSKIAKKLPGRAESAVKNRWYNAKTSEERRKKRMENPKPDATVSPSPVEHLSRFVEGVIARTG